jgi:O-6-methylguanine DNA methyltransferase
MNQRVKPSSERMKIVRLKTSWGPIVLTLDGKAVVECTLPFLKNTPRKPFAIDGFQCPEGNCVAAQRFASQVQSFFQPLGKAASPDAVSPNIGNPEGTEFQRAVWKEIRKIPRGQTRTYGEIAAAIGRPNAVRAVGSACGANPIPLWIPCHRVVAKNGLGGFGSGLPWKKMLLELEGWGNGVLE